MEKFLKMEKDTETAIKMWKDSQFDLADIIMSLTDQNINQGFILLGFFNSKEVAQVCQVFSFNFKLMKSMLGINGDYVERKGDIFSKDFKAIKHSEVLTLSKKEMTQKVDEMFKSLLKEINATTKKLNKIIGK